MNPKSGATVRFGLTLIEVIVVLLIIAILIGLSLPILRGALGKAEDAESRNELNQIAVAYDDFFVAWKRGPKNSDELSPFYEKNNRINRDLKDRRIIVRWDMSPPSGILAYMTEADAFGNHLVAWAGGSVESITADELKAYLK
jgi:prepilin-type N-terminal cleavage/methylation domain-containing protein